MAVQVVGLLVTRCCRPMSCLMRWSCLTFPTRRSAPSMMTPANFTPSQQSCRRLLLFYHSNGRPHPPAHIASYPPQHHLYQEMIAMHPIEYATVSSRVIAIGGSFTVFLVSHCAYLLLHSADVPEPPDWHMRLLQFLCLARLLAALPRPYVWFRFYRLHSAALRESSALRIAQRCLAAVHAHCLLTAAPQPQPAPSQQHPHPHPHPQACLLKPSRATAHRRDMTNNNNHHPAPRTTTIATTPHHLSQSPSPPHLVRPANPQHVHARARTPHGQQAMPPPRFFSRSRLLLGPSCTSYDPISVCVRARIRTTIGGCG